MITRQTDVIRNQLARNHIAMVTGTGRFADAHSIWIDGGTGRDTKVTADKIIIAAGTRPARPDSVDFDDRTIVDSDGVINLRPCRAAWSWSAPGVIGMEYASMFAALGTKVTVVERREKMLDFCDEEIVESLKYHLRDLSVTFRFGEEVAAVERHQTAALCILKSGKKIVADTVMYSAGRQGQTDDLALEAAGLSADRRGRIDGGRQLPHRGRQHLRGRGRDRLSRRSPRPRWSRGGSPPSTPAASRCARCTSCSRSASTRSRRSASSGRPRTS